VDNRHLRTISGPLPWFAEESMEDLRRPSAAPPTNFSAFSSDAVDRFWTLTRVPDREWRAARAQQVGSENIIPSDQMDAFFDHRLDVFDLSTREHLGAVEFDGVGHQLLEMNGRIHVYLVEYPTETHPQVVIYRASILRK
jgi:hypothetical protein